MRSLREDFISREARLARQIFKRECFLLLKKELRIPRALCERILFLAKHAEPAEFLNESVFFFLKKELCVPCALCERILFLTKRAESAKFFWNAGTVFPFKKDFARLSVFRERTFLRLSR